MQIRKILILACLRQKRLKDTVKAEAFKKDENVLAPREGAFYMGVFVSQGLIALALW